MLVRSLLLLAAVLSGGSHHRQAPPDATQSSVGASAPKGIEKARRSAVVVGVQTYGAGIPALQSPESDATRVADALKKLGFHVTLLLGNKATKSSILAAIQNAGKPLGDKDHFVFYFAGHGSNRPAGLLPSDAKEDGTNFVTREELRGTILAAAGKAATRTVLLDSCFSAAMSQARGFPANSRARVFIRRGGGLDEDDNPPAAGNDATNPFGQDGKIIFVAAALANEPAIETVIDGKPTGVFTDALVPELKEPVISWQTAINRIRKRTLATLQASGDQQNPSVNPIQAQTVKMFSVVKAENVPPKSLLDLQAYEHPDDKVFTMSLAQPGSNFEAGQLLKLDFGIQKSGYLVVTSYEGGRYILVVPSKSDGPVVAVQGSFQLPRPKNLLTFNRFGSDHVLALLFTDKDRAKAAADAFRSLGASGGDMRDLDATSLDATANKGEVYTRRMSFTIGARLVGGAEKGRNLDELAARIQTPRDPVALWLADLRPLQVSFVSLVKPDADPEVQQAGLVLYLNLAVQSSKPLVGNASPLAASLASETRTLLQSNPTGADLLKANRWILEDLLPAHFAKATKNGGRR